MSDGSELDLSLLQAMGEHDGSTQALGIWLGAEPTFTDRLSEEPEWLSDALGRGKEARARELLTRLAARRPGGLVLRPLGRKYARELSPRFCYGLLERRDATPIWTGPPDRLHDGEPCAESRALVPDFSRRLCHAFARAGFSASLVENAKGDAGRVLLRTDERRAVCDAARDPRLARGSIHAARKAGDDEPTPVDALAGEGSLLLLVHPGGGGAGQPDANQLWLELPAFPSVFELLRAVTAIAQTCRECGVESLGLRGFSPCVDETVAWTSITPDPAVIEINQAPYPDVASFHRATEELYSLAAEVGLSPYRLHYNGAVCDSGGGGQLTFGGPSPESSPFFTCPALLPRLIRYVVRHPSLSYWFATQYVGGSSQSPRPDEGARESFLELSVALEQLSLQPSPSPELLWSTLRHFLADASGNPHRSELNIEKLHNPFLPARGRLGLVELRALSMAASARTATARAMLLRGVLAMLMRHDVVTELTDWRDVLHDRFALPFYLERDLREVFHDLRRRGLGLGHRLEGELLTRDDGLLADVMFEGLRVRVDQALEFWPLVGDVATQEAVSSRLVDASTSRLQVYIESEEAEADQGVEVCVNGHVVPLREEQGPRGPCRVFGLRYRSFVPWTGLHPSMPAESQVALELSHPSGRGLRLTLHPWRPDGLAYPGLPDSPQDARERRLSRCQVEALSEPTWPAARSAPKAALSEHNLDLRRLVR